jgi:hypothetical protein
VDTLSVNPMSRDQIKGRSLNVATLKLWRSEISKERIEHDFAERMLESRTTDKSWETTMCFGIDVLRAALARLTLVWMR